MIISSTDIKNNFGKYIRLAAKEDIIITKNGKTVGKLIAYDGEAAYDGVENAKAVRNDLIIRESNAARKYYGNKALYKEFIEMALNSDERYELIDGEIFCLASPKNTHQMLLLRMSNIFYDWFKDKKCTPAIAPYDIRLKRNDAGLYGDKDGWNMVQPDLMVLCDLDESLDENDNYIGIPALVVEITSNSTRSRDYVKKLDLYMSCGIREYWIVDPDSRRVHVFLFSNNEISRNMTYTFDEDIKSFHFEHFIVNLRS